MSLKHGDLCSKVVVVVVVVVVVGVVLLTPSRLLPPYEKRPKHVQKAYPDAKHSPTRSTSREQHFRHPRCTLAFPAFHLVVVQDMT
jgi:hypothetical protein